MNLCDGKLELYSGNDDQVVPLLSLGGLGVIFVLSNIAPRQTHDIVMEFLEGDYKKAAKLQLDVFNRASCSPERPVVHTTTGI